MGARHAGLPYVARGGPSVTAAASEHPWRGWFLQLDRPAPSPASARSTVKNPAHTVGSGATITTLAKGEARGEKRQPEAPEFLGRFSDDATTRASVSISDGLTEGERWTTKCGRGGTFVCSGKGVTCTQYRANREVVFVLEPLLAWALSCAVYNELRRSLFVK